MPKCPRCGGWLVWSQEDQAAYCWMCGRYFYKRRPEPMREFPRQSGHQGPRTSQGGRPPASGLDVYPTTRHGWDFENQ